MAYATVSDVQARLTRTLSETEETVCENLLEDIAVMIDVRAADADSDAKKIVSCRAVVRAIGSDASFPVGVTQGSQSALGYSQSWTVSGGSIGELYLSKEDRLLLGRGNAIGSYSPVEALAED